jgi:hypothetical protein
VKAEPTVLPEVRQALDSGNEPVRERETRIVAWQGDQDSLENLRAIRTTSGPDADLAAWAIVKSKN